MIPASIHNAVIEGLQKLLVLRLKNAPAQETITAVASVWIEAIAYNCCWKDEDAKRIQQGFSVLISHCTDWPAPRQLLDNIPPPPDPPRIAPPPVSPEQRAKVQAMLSELAQQLTRTP